MRPDAVNVSKDKLIGRYLSWAIDPRRATNRIRGTFHSPKCHRLRGPTYSRMIGAHGEVRKEAEETMAGIWQALTNQPPFTVSTMLLLTDGTVMCSESDGQHWWRLTPDAFGNYVQGTWSPLASAHHARLYFASAVLSDGRVFVAGGEYEGALGQDEQDTVEIYQPILNLWTEIAPPAGWTHIGDAPCCTLPDGRVLLGSIGSTDTAIFDPQTNSFTPGPNKGDASEEETWTLLADGSVLTVQCSNIPHAEKYVPAANAWVSASSTPQSLVQASSSEIGPALLLPDGRVFAIGATGHTALYTSPPIASQPGAWTSGPDFPPDGNGALMEAKDAPACLLPNGKVLCTASPASDTTYPGPTSFFEYDGVSLNAVGAPNNAGGACYHGRMLVVPTGQVLFAADSADIAVYTPDGAPDPAWAPHITSHPVFVREKQTYTLNGYQLNGLSQAVSYGDDATMATNYPIVRIRSLNSGHVHYCRTFYFSTMAVATGFATQTTSFKVPVGVEHGFAELCVIANGIASDCVRVLVGPYLPQFPINEALVNRLIGSLADGPLWVLGPHGPVPVDPWGPEIEKQVRAIYASIIAQVRELTAIGRELEQRQIAEAEAALKQQRGPMLSSRQSKQVAQAADGRTRQSPVRARRH